MQNEHAPLLRDDETQKPRSSGVIKLLAGLVGVFLASADKSILLTTQNHIASALKSPSSASLLLVSYNLGFCVALPVYGFLSDIYGSRNFLLASYALFSIGCVISGAVDSLWPFVFGRFLAGVGGSGMTDLLSVLINEVFEVSEIASVRSFVIAAEIFGQGCGGPLGGLITDSIGWRWALLGQAPIGIICLMLAYWQLPRVPRKNDMQLALSLWSFDYLGLVSFVVSATAFVLGTTEGIEGLADHKLALFITSVISFGILVLIEKLSSRPIFPSSIIMAPGLRNIFLAQVMFFANVSTFLNNLPQYLSQIEQLNSTQIALCIWPSCLGLIIGAMIAGKVLRTTVKYREISLIGLAICVVSLALMIIRWRDGIQGPEVYYGFPFAVGCGILLSAQFLALTVWSPEQMANATAIYCLVQQIGQILGTSGSAAALQQVFRLRMGTNLKSTPLPQKKKIIRNVLRNFDSIAKLPENLQVIIRFSYIEAYRLVPALGAILTIISGILIYFS